jgi:hypothetical protein
MSNCFIIIAPSTLCSHHRPTAYPVSCSYSSPAVTLCPTNTPASHQQLSCHPCYRLIPHAAKSESLSGMGVNHLALQYRAMTISANETAKILQKLQNINFISGYPYINDQMTAFRCETKRITLVCIVSYDQNSLTVPSALG